jgi:hypothetical protein
MFERFRRSRGTNTEAGSVATRERDTTDRELDESSDRVETARFERESPGERDRGVIAGGGDADLAADRSFEHDRMARGDGDADGAADRSLEHDRTARGGGDATDTALDRHAARDDLARDEATTPDRTDRTGDSAVGDRTDDADRHHHDDHTGGRGGAIAVGGAGAAAGAAAAHHHREEEREDAGRDDDGRTLVHDRGDADTTDRLADDDRDRTVAREHDLDRDGVDDRTEHHAPVLAPAALATMRDRQRDRFGGIQWGSDFFGWLCAIGLASLLTAALVGAGVALGLSTDDATNAGTADQIGLGGGIALILVLAVAWFCGGYVAGRMARFDGARQGLGVWAWTILAAVVVALVALIGGSDYDVYQRLNLPRLAVGDSTLSTGGAIAGAAAVLVTLLFAVLGGKVGERFHKRVDRVATDEYVTER